MMELKVEESRSDLMGPFPTVCVLVNACMGMGFLTLPYSVSRAGIAASVAAVTIMTVACIASGYLLLDAMARANAIKTRTESPQARGNERMPLYESTPFNIEARLPLTEIVGILFGPTAVAIVLVVITLTAFFVLVAYVSLIASSFAQIVDFPEGSNCSVYSDDWCMPRYRMFVLIFAVPFALLAYLDIREQTSFQIAMTCARAILVAIIVGDSFRMLVSGAAPPPPGAGFKEEWPKTAPLFETNLGALARVVASASFALGLLFVMPEIIHDLGDKRQYASCTVATAITCCGTVYVITMVLVASVFGQWTVPLCTLNWANSANGLWKHLLIIVPVLDICASFPVYAHTLGANVCGGCEALGLKGIPISAWRTGLAVLPCFVSWYIYDVSVPVAWVGVTAAVLSCMLPTLVWLGASRKSNALFTAEELATNPFRQEASSLLTVVLLAIGALISCVSFFGAFWGPGDVDTESSSTLAQFFMSPAKKV